MNAILHTLPIDNFAGSAVTQFDLLDLVNSQSHRGYPYAPGFKSAGASMEAADVMQQSGSRNLWMQRCADLFGMRPDWTAEEGIAFYAQKLKDDIRIIDKGLRPRFTELSNNGFLIKTDQRRGTNRIKPHVYRRAA